jgi:serine/threonine protein kinase
MAEVFHTIATGPEGFQRSLVIKRMLPHLSQDASFVRMFIDEAKLSGLLSHPNLVQIFEFGKVEDSFFIAMEYVHGRTLAALQMKLVETGRLAPVAASVEIVRQIGVGLHYAHALQSAEGKPLGIVHRDISPSNLMLAFHGGVKILDFGIARVADGLREFRTQVGTMKGKISYMSPEQIHLEEIDHRSDIFAVGIVLHELLTGRRLFRAGSDYAASRLVLDLAIPPPSMLNPEVPAELDRVVMRALERDRDARYQVAGEMAADLEQLMLELRISPHEHKKLLHDLFPNDPTHSGDVGVIIPTPVSPREAAMVESRERITSATPGAVPSPSYVVDMGSYGSANRLQRPGGRASSRKWMAAGALVLLAAIAVPVALRSRTAVDGRRGSPSTAEPAMVATGRPASPPRAAVVHLSLDSTPQDSQVIEIDSGRVVGRTPVTVARPPSGGVIAFRFEHAGYNAAVYKVIPDLDKAMHVALEKEIGIEPPAAAAPARSPTSANPVGPARGQPLSRAARLRENARANKAAQSARQPSGSSMAAAAVRECRLTVGSFPWAELWVDGADSGLHTPVVQLPIGCGAHKLRLKRADLRIDHPVEVTLTAGREFKQQYQLGSEDD